MIINANIFKFCLFKTVQKENILLNCNNKLYKHFCIFENFELYAIIIVR